MAYIFLAIMLAIFFLISSVDARMGKSAQKIANANSLASLQSSLSESLQTTSTLFHAIRDSLTHSHHTNMYTNLMGADYDKEQLEKDNHASDMDIIAKGKADNVNESWKELIKIEKSVLDREINQRPSKLSTDRYKIMIQDAIQEFNTSLNEYQEAKIDSIKAWMDSLKYASQFVLLIQEFAMDYQSKATKATSDYYNSDNENLVIAEQAELDNFRSSLGYLEILNSLLTRSSVMKSNVEKIISESEIDKVSLITKLHQAFDDFNSIELTKQNEAAEEVIKILKAFCKEAIKTVSTNSEVLQNQLNDYSLVTNQVLTSSTVSSTSIIAYAQNHVKDSKKYLKDKKGGEEYKHKLVHSRVSVTKTFLMEICSISDLPCGEDCTDTGFTGEPGLCTCDAGYFGSAEYVRGEYTGCNICPSNSHTLPANGLTSCSPISCFGPVYQGDAGNCQCGYGFLGIVGYENGMPTGCSQIPCSGVGYSLVDGKCVCDKGFAGEVSYTETEVYGCTAISCDHKGYSGDNGFCTCDNHFVGEVVYVDNKPSGCVPYKCSQTKGYVVDTDGVSCLCDEGYSGRPSYSKNELVGCKACPSGTWQTQSGVDLECKPVECSIVGYSGEPGACECAFGYKGIVEYQRNELSGCSIIPCEGAGYKSETLEGAERYLTCQCDDNYVGYVNFDGGVIGGCSACPVGSYSKSAPKILACEKISCDPIGYKGEAGACICDFGYGGKVNYDGGVIGGCSPIDCVGKGYVASYAQDNRILSRWITCDCDLENGYAGIVNFENDTLEGCNLVDCNSVEGYIGEPGKCTCDGLNGWVLHDKITYTYDGKIKGCKPFACNQEGYSGNSGSCHCDNGYAGSVSFDDNGVIHGCEKCPKGSYADAGNGNKCELISCSKDGYTEVLNDDIEKSSSLRGGECTCSEGYFGTVEFNKNSVSGCLKCPTGFYTSSPGNRNHCLPIPCDVEGYAGESGSCHCDINYVGQVTYSKGVLMGCEKCPDGSISNKDNTECIPIKCSSEGYRGESGKCECDNNFIGTVSYTASGNLNGCFPCDYGSFSLGGDDKLCTEYEIPADGGFAWAPDNRKTKDDNNQNNNNNNNNNNDSSTSNSDASNSNGGDGSNSNGGDDSNSNGGDGSNSNGGDGSNSNGGDGSNSNGGDGSNSNGGDGSNSNGGDTSDSNSSDSSSNDNDSSGSNSSGSSNNLILVCKAGYEGTVEFVDGLVQGCKECKLGFYTEEGNGNVCKPIESDSPAYICNNGVCSCADGFFGTVVFVDGKPSGCGLCPEGTWAAIGDAKCKNVDCVGDGFVTTKDNKCICGEGYEGSVSVEDGKYIGCKKCSTGEYSLSGNGESCFSISCQSEGYVGNDGSCTCDKNYIGTVKYDRDLTTGCKKCPFGYTSDAGNGKSCSKVECDIPGYTTDEDGVHCMCADNFYGSVVYTENSVSGCKPCPVAFFSLAGNDNECQLVKCNVEGYSGDDGYCKCDFGYDGEVIYKDGKLTGCSKKVNLK